MLDVLKRQWFIGVVAIVLLSTLVFYVYEQNKDNLPAKRVGGKDIVFSVGDVDVTTDEFFDRLYAQFGIDAVYMFFDRAVVEAAVADSNVFTTKAQVDAEGVKQNFQEYYGAAYETFLLDALKSLGYSSLSDLDRYFVYVYKRQELFKSYADDNMDTLFPSFNETNLPRVVSHVLITMDDASNPTAEEQTRFDNAKAALENGMSFEELVRTYSDDTSNNLNNGLLGYMDVNTSFVPEFKLAALSLEAGELSDWVMTTYGYHLIRMDANDLNALKNYQEFYDALLGQDQALQSRIIWEKAEALNVDFFGNDELMASLKKYMGIED
jgi:foldase protein PrsA